MQEVTCFHCRTVVQITPDDDHCSNCGEDLRGLLHRDQVSDYFCQRVADFAASGRSEEALSEAERGLTYHNVAELHMLAAMIAEGLERYDVMRGHVAAIPLDDSLRSEAEWLLRAHQERQRALREGEKQERSGSQSGVGSLLLADVLGKQPETPLSPRKNVQVWTGAAAFLIVVILFVTWFARGQRTGGIAERPDTPDQAVSGETAPLSPQQVPVDNQIEPARQPLQPAQAAGEMQADRVVEEPLSQAEPAPTVAVETERLLPIPTPSVPKDLVLPATQNEAIVDSNPRSVVVLSADGFDLERVLRDNGYPDLAELPIDARLQEGKLVLNGLIHLDLQRRQILEALETVPGISDVSAVNLLLRPKQTYTVRPGDTLWTIVYDIYGDVERVEEFYLANLDVAPSPDALRVGDELHVPPIE